MIYTTKRVGNDKHTAHVWRFDNSAAFADAITANGGQAIASRGLWGNHAGGQTYETASARCYTGDDSLVAAAEKMLDQIDADGIERRRSEWVASPAGAFPLVPAYLAGRPDAMRRRIEVQTDRAPVRIYFDGTSSAGISAADLTKRGTAVLAFAMALSAERPVELFSIASLSHGSVDGGVTVVRIPAAPLELSTACNLLTSQGYTRGLCYGWLIGHGGCGGSWPFGILPTNEARMGSSVALMREALDCEPQDLLIPVICLGDEMTKDPVGWINRTLAKYRNTEEEAA